MAFGISEGLLQKAYGPVDLGGFYSSLNSIAKKAEADYNLEKKTAIQESYKIEKDLSKNLGKVREEDRPDVLKAYNEWKTTTRELDRNPNMINRNTERYNELKNASTSKFSEVQSLIKESLDVDADITKIGTSYVSNMKKFDPDFSTVFGSAKKLTSKEYIAKGYNNPDVWMYKGVSGDFYKKVSNASKESLEDGVEILGDSPLGGKTINTFTGIINSNKLLNKITSVVYGEKNPSYAMSDYLEKEKANIPIITKRFQNLSEEDLSKYKDNDGNDLYPKDPTTGSRIPTMPEVTGDNPADAISYIFMREFVNNIPKIKERGAIMGIGKAEQKIKYAELTRKAQLANSIWLKNYSFSLGEKSDNSESQLISVGKAIKEMTKSGNLNDVNDILSKVPGYDNAVIKPAFMYSAKNKPTIDNLVSYLGNIDKSIKTYQDLNRLGVPAVAKMLGVTEEQYKNGVALVHGKSVDGTDQIQAIPVDENFELKWANLNQGAFGTKEKTRVGKATGKAVSEATGIVPTTSTTTTGKKSWKQLTTQ